MSIHDYIYCERSQERKKLNLIANLRLFTYTDIFILVLPRVLKMFLSYFSIRATRIISQKSTPFWRI
jgi:hypothetical protein